MKAKSQRLLKVGIAVFVVFWLMSNCAFAEEDNSGKKLTDELEHIELEETKENYDAGTRLSRVDNVVVFLRFSDVDEYVNPALIGQADQMYHAGKDALKKYVERISYHKVTTSAAFFPKENDGSTYCSVQISKPLTFFERQYRDESGNLTGGYTTFSERIERERLLVQEALGAVKAQIEAAGLELDNDGNSIVDSITFVLPTGIYGGHIGYGDLLWPHRLKGMKTGITLNGSNVSEFMLVSDASVTADPKQLIHEFMHTLGMPDLYRGSAQYVYPVGMWDIMDGGADGPVSICSWYQREYLNYGAKLPVFTESTKNITLSAPEYVNENEQYAIIVKPPYNSDEYFVIENRRSEDATQQSSGLLVYRINEGSDAGTPQKGNINSDGISVKDFIFIFRPGETDYNAGIGEIGYAALSPKNARGFTKLGKPRGVETEAYDNQIIYYSDGTNSGLIVSNIRINGSKTTFDITISEGSSGEEEKPSEETALLDAFIQGLYNNIMRRECQMDELAMWRERLLSGQYSVADAVKEIDSLAGNYMYTLSDKDFVELLYRALLQRAPDKNGTLTWLTYLKNGALKQMVLRGFITSSEFIQKCQEYKIVPGDVTPWISGGENIDRETFVWQCYQEILERSPDRTGWTYWNNLLKKGRVSKADVLHGFLFSIEYQERKVSDEQFIKMLYKVVLNRAFDKHGLENWMNELCRGKSREDIFKAFINSTEYKDASFL